MQMMKQKTQQGFTLILGEIQRLQSQPIAPTTSSSPRTTSSPSAAPTPAPAPPQRSAATKRTTMRRKERGVVKQRSGRARVVGD
jgi:hypothetical protein